ncbi:hypothetical protein DUI87_15176 [Hirundo rustica rustica]|uniref:Integrase catalytic domain-containing protein n=1 Tax=Hirundo rustica rustica TaxID=333673 RepID=A0A3M0K4N2_HIRRU|nr:hypothetical protein DUI87_15176 [Hirundo rustica rustica]
MISSGALNSNKPLPRSSRRSLIAVALDPVRTGPDVKNVLYSAARNNGLSWSLWQKVPGETRGRPLGFWSRSYRGPKPTTLQQRRKSWPPMKEFKLPQRLHKPLEEKVGQANSLNSKLFSWPWTLLKERSGQSSTSTLIRGWWPMLCGVGWTGGKRPIGSVGEKPIWAADEWKDIDTQVEKLLVKVHHVNAHVPKSWANEEHQNNEQVAQAAKIEVSKIDLDWQHKGELFLARWAHDASGHQGRDATYKWGRDRGVDLTMDSISQVIHDCETCAAIKQAKWVKPLWYGGRWSKYKYGEAWQIDYITLPQTRQGKRYVLTMVEATTGWLETYPVPHATAGNTILGLEKQILWRHGTPWED